MIYRKQSRIVLQKYYNLSKYCFFFLFFLSNISLFLHFFGVIEQ
ncbi:hypothetical protein HMPREF3226_00498 [Prevotella corporis]|uniref:Uncharacterized protein n=1 Tax=Prevotella corporis TaxID=28128 RepID=A0A133QJV4_9BACT|nr:hypothetical protein HMPREF3226_00498 [Prevotella corporis]